MLRHRGKQRTPFHNRKLASLLSFVAGMVNVASFFALGHLTTNVTGHVAFMADELSQRNYLYSLIYFGFILSFLLGAFSSNLYMEVVYERFPRFRYTVPVLLELVILTGISLLSFSTIESYPVEIACTLLFSMGMQNALVTNISKAVVRTTHLTGLFTDLGIELSQLVFYRKYSQVKNLKTSIKLRLIIIFSFLFGGVVAGVAYPYYGLRVLIISSAVLLFALVYDSVKFQLVTMSRKYRKRRRENSNKK